MADVESNPSGPLIRTTSDSLTTSEWVHCTPGHACQPWDNQDPNGTSTHTVAVSPAAVGDVMVLFISQQSPDSGAYTS